MPYYFLNYLQPAYYFSIPRKNKGYIYPKLNCVEESILKQIPEHSIFSSKTAQTYCRSWQLVQSGYIASTKTYDHFERVPIQDEYKFIAMWFHKIWVYYILLIRIISFHNPILEIAAFNKARGIDRNKYGIKPLTQDRFNSYQSKLLADAPLVSIIIPTLNRYLYLEDAIKDIYNQTYQNFEIIIVDQSHPFQESFYKKFDERLVVVFQSEKALWLARNTAINMSKGDYILLFDDDSRVEKNWIANHLKCMDFYNCDISSGVSISSVGDRVPKHYSYFMVSSQLDTGNVLIKKSVFVTTGLFDRQFEKQRMGDGEFGLRCFLEGFKNISNPYAERLHLKVGTGGLRQMGSWDAFRPKKWFAPRPIPSVLYLYRKYFGRKRALLALLKSVPPSIIPYRFKKNRKLLMLGMFISVFLFPLIITQVLISWQKASKKLKEGAIIPALE